MESQQRLSSSSNNQVTQVSLSATNIGGQNNREDVDHKREENIAPATPNNPSSNRCATSENNIGKKLEQLSVTQPLPYSSLTTIAVNKEDQAVKDDVLNTDVDDSVMEASDTYTGILEKRFKKVVKILRTL